MHLIRIFIKRAFGFSKALFLLFYHLGGIVVLKNGGGIFFISLYHPGAVRGAS